MPFESGLSSLLLIRCFCLSLALMPQGTPLPREPSLQCPAHLSPASEWMQVSFTQPGAPRPGGTLSFQEATSSSELMAICPTEGKLGAPWCHRHPLNCCCWVSLHSGTRSPRDSFPLRSSLHGVEKAKVSPCPRLKPQVMYHRVEETLHPEILKRHPVLQEHQNFKKGLRPILINCHKLLSL